MTVSKSLGQHFDEWASAYDGAIRRMVPHYDRINETLLALLDQRPPRRLLDLGPGTGHTLDLVLQRYSTAEVVGLDVSSQMLVQARERLAQYSDRVTLVQGDLTDPTALGQFDVAISILAVHHLAADAKRLLFARLRSQLRESGNFILIDYFSPALARLNALYDLPDEPDAHEAEHDRPNTLAEQIRWLGDAGFSAVEVIWKTDDIAVLLASAEPFDAP